ncbi:MAG: dehydrogenase, partial [Armatimonadetes bacterium]|nr:dehydrogenase [Armatimonadota bacterium]
MPKSIPIHPQDVRKSGQLSFDPIPMNQYNRTVAQEKTKYGTEALTRIHRDMAVIRAFESMLNDVKIKGNYQGIVYDHRGPAHRSIGQEAS